jgi:hypothetical protein
VGEELSNGKDTVEGTALEGEGEVEERGRLIAEVHA